MLFSPEALIFAIEHRQHQRQRLHENRNHIRIRSPVPPTFPAGDALCRTHRRFGTRSRGHRAGGLHRAARRRFQPDPPEGELSLPLRAQRGARPPARPDEEPLLRHQLEGDGAPGRRRERPRRRTGYDRADCGHLPPDRGAARTGTPHLQDDLHRAQKLRRDGPPAFALAPHREDPHVALVQSPAQNIDVLPHAFLGPGQPESAPPRIRF